MMLWTQSQTAYRVTGSSRVVLAAILLAPGLLAEPGAGQTPGVEGIAQVSVPRANFRATCSMSAEVIATLTAGEEVEVLDTAGSWYHVRHTESGIEGCMHQTVLGVATSLSEEEAEELEEWEEEIHEREAEAHEAELEAERERREVELEAREEEAERRAREAEWAARRARGEKRVTGYVDVNLGLATPGEDSLDVTGLEAHLRNPTRVWPAGSNVDSRYEFDPDLTYAVGGGVLVALPAGGSIGGGATLARTTYTTDVTSVWTLGDPSFRFTAFTDRFEGHGPDRTETTLHVHAIYVPPLTGVTRVRLFAGPTVFRAEFPAVTGASLLVTETPWAFDLVALEYDEQSDTVIGGHVGADVSFYLSRNFGLGVSLLYSQGTAEFRFTPPDAPGGVLEEDVTVGGLSAMFGVRFRF